MNEMIERVAKAMFAHAKAAPESDIRERDFSDMQADEQDFAIGLARAAIGAIEKMGFVIVPREPTEAVIEAGRSRSGRLDSRGRSSGEGLIL